MSVILEAAPSFPEWKILRQSWITSYTLHAPEPPRTLYYALGAHSGAECVVRAHCTRLIWKYGSWDLDTDSFYVPVGIEPKNLCNLGYRTDRAEPHWEEHGVIPSSRITVHHPWDHPDFRLPVQVHLFVQFPATGA